MAVKGWSVHSKAIWGRTHTEHARLFYVFTYTLVDESSFFLFSGSGEDEECLLLCISFTSDLLSVLTDGEVDLQNTACYKLLLIDKNQTQAKYGIHFILCFLIRLYHSGK
jgi:hypothetical protein